MKTGVVVQTRMGSTRLPGKVMLDICGKPVIEHVIDRLGQSKYLDEFIIATTVLPQDDVIAEKAENIGVKCFRGNEEDVLSRYYYAAKQHNLDIIVRVTSDCPLIDPFIIDNMLKFFISNDFDLVANVAPNITQRTFPRGLDAEVFSFLSLERAFNNAAKQYQREHVTPYIYEEGSRIYYYKNNIDYSKYRWTLDTEEDFELITAVYRHLYKGNHDFYFKDILELLKRFPEIADINAAVEQKKIK